MRSSFFLLLFCFLPAVAFGGEVKKGGVKQEREKIVVTSEKMISESGKNRARFMGNVVAVYGELTLKSQEMEVYSDGEQKELKRLIATGDVVITKGERVAKGERAELYNAEKKIIITGNASIIEKGNNISGEKIIYFYDKEDIIVEGSMTERASFKINPSDKEKRLEDSEDNDEPTPAQAE